MKRIKATMKIRGSRYFIATLLLSAVLACCSYASFSQGTRGENNAPVNPATDTVKFIPPIVAPEKIELLDGDTVFASYKLEVQADYPGGMGEFYVYLRKNLKYPTATIDQDVKGKVVVVAVIEKTGIISHVSVKNTNHSALDEEVVRVFSSSGAWIPGKRHGKVVHSRIQIPIYINWK